MTIWAAVDRTVDQAAEYAGLRAHGLNVWAAHRWYDTGREVPPAFQEDERAAAIVALSAPSLLAWLRGVVDGPMVVLKGPEVAARYPDPALRPFGDLDLLVPDADEVQRMLLLAGCQELTQARPEHRPTLRCPGSPLLIEVHQRPKWPMWTTARTDELFASAVPSALGVEGVLTLPPTQHAVLLAAHSWQHEPFRRVIDLVDIAAMSADLPPGELRAQARQWGLQPVWDATQRVIDAFERGEHPRRWAERLLTRHVWSLRERTLLEWRCARWAGGFWAQSPRTAVWAVAATIADDVRPPAAGTWRSKARRVPGSLARSFRPWSESTG